MLIIMFYVFKYFNSHPFRISSPKFDETGQPNNTPTFSYDFDPRMTFLQINYGATIFWKCSHF